MRLRLLVFSVSMAVSVPALAYTNVMPTGSGPVSAGEALSLIAQANSADGPDLEQRIRSINQSYGTQKTFSSGAMTAGQAVGDSAAATAGQHYDTATGQSMAGAANHRQGDEATDVAPAAQSSADSMNGPIANHEAQGNAYEQDASNAENYVCTATNKQGQCTAGYWNCNSTCQEYRALAQQQFRLAGIDQQQQSAMQSQANGLSAQGVSQKAAHVKLDGEANQNKNTAYNGNVQGSAQTGALQQQGQAQIEQDAKTSTDQELARIRASMKVPGENLPYHLPNIPAQSANTLTAQVKAQIDALQAKATRLADTAMQESKAAGEAYRQYKAYLAAEQQAEQQAATDAANAASAPTPSSRAAWASAAAAMRAKAAQDAQDAAHQHAIYTQQKHLAETHTDQSKALAQQEVAVAKSDVENTATAQIQSYLH